MIGLSMSSSNVFVSCVPPLYLSLLEISCFNWLSALDSPCYFSCSLSFSHFVFLRVSVLHHTKKEQNLYIPSVLFFFKTIMFLAPKVSDVVAELSFFFPLT